VAIDGRAIAVTVVVAIFTVLVTGLAPALRSAHGDLGASLHGGDGASAGGFRGVRASRWRDGLLVGEAAFAVLLLVAAVLLARSSCAYCMSIRAIAPTTCSSRRCFSRKATAPRRAMRCAR
jgi:hypothetical protein